MKNLSKLLERFSKSLNQDSKKKEFISEVIKNNTKIDLPESKLSLKEGVLSVQCGPVLKNEIKLKEERILNELRERHRMTVSRIFYK